MLGHSLGEISALCAADVISLPDAVRLVRKRGEAMRDATAFLPTAMAALSPCSPRLAQRLCRQAGVETGGVCVVACINTSLQQVIAGHAKAVERAMALGKAGMDGEEGETGRVRRAVLLDVSAAFHSPLMQPAQDAMRESIQSTSPHTGRHDKERIAVMTRCD
jgi:[acyl-carrier-protein] S-malonyltransferase